MEITVESFKIDGWEEWQKGLLLAENEEWILVNEIYADYMLDGFCLYKKEFVNQRLNGKSERLIERVFKLRRDKHTLTTNLKLQTPSKF